MTKINAWLGKSSMGRTSITVEARLSSLFFPEASFYPQQGTSQGGWICYGLSRVFVCFTLALPYAVELGITRSSLCALMCFCLTLPLPNAVELGITWSSLCALMCFSLTIANLASLSYLSSIFYPQQWHAQGRINIYDTKMWTNTKSL